MIVTASVVAIVNAIMNSTVLTNVVMGVLTVSIQEITRIHLFPVLLKVVPIAEVITHTEDLRKISLKRSHKIAIDTLTR